MELVLELIDNALKYVLKRVYKSDESRLSRYLYDFQSTSKFTDLNQIPECLQTDRSDIPLTLFVLFIVVTNCGVVFLTPVSCRYLVSC